MSLANRSLDVRVRIVLARALERLGWPGVAGVALAIAAFAALAWERPPAPPAPGQPLPADAPAAERTPEHASADVATLPPADDLALLLTRIQRESIAQGLGWPKADYRFDAATADAPASVEVRCALKGPYPNVRRFVTQLLQDMPTLTLREFSLSRPTSDVTDVEAKLALVIYLADMPPSARGGE